MAGVWDRYDRWNDAFVEVIFWGASDSQPVYLDIDNDVLLRVAARVGIEGTAEEIERVFFSDLRSTLNIDAAYRDDGPVFARHREHAASWWRRHRRSGADLTEAPPVIALLAGFSRAAEHMVRDDEFSSAAYFPRLIQLLEVKEADHGRTQASFRAESESFWGLLNQWLDDANGAFGLPTAESIGPRYVGIPLSQALLRESDRQHLERFFEQARLEPGLLLGPADMADHLSDWFSAGHGSGSLKRLWGLKSARRVLIDSVCQLLAAWPGPQPSEGAGGETQVARALSGQLVLTARIRRPALGSARLVMGFAVREPAVARKATSDWVVESAEGSDKPIVELEPLTDILFGLPSAESVSDESLLSGTIRLKSCESGVLAERKSTPMCVMMRSEEAGLYVEVLSARRDVEHLILVNSAARRPNGKPAFDLDPLLDEIARPGFTKEDALPGLPSGWIAYRGVIIERSHTRDERILDCLRPAASTAIVIDGGLRLPGRQERWCEGSDLQIRVSSEGAGSLTLSLTRTEAGTDHKVESWEFTGSEAAVSLEADVLTRGRFRLDLEARMLGTSVAQARRTFMVASADDPRPSPLGGEVVAYTRIEGALPAELAGSVVSAELEAVARGAVCRLELPLNPLPLAERAMALPWWSAPSDRLVPMKLAEPAAPDSCVFTGAHHEDITSPPGSKLDRGECRKCGQVRMYRKRAPLRRTAPKPRELEQPKSTPLAPIQSRALPRADLLIDALTWMQSGNFSEFAHVVRQFDDSALSVYEALTDLESVGHIDVARDPASLRVTHWQMAPRCLAQAADGRWSVIGAWDTGGRRRLKAGVSELGGTLHVEEGVWFKPVAIQGLAESDVALLADDVSAEVVAQAGRSLLSRLHPLAAACRGLPRLSSQGMVDVEWFLANDASWRNVKVMTQAGAYRSSAGFVSSYFLRQEADIERGMTARATAPIAKHGASVGRPLLGFDHDSQALLVPLGAELPALYGRAMALMAGRPAVKVVVGGNVPCLAYRGVSSSDAQQLLSLLSEGIA